VDAEANLLLDLDTRREVSLCFVPIGRRSESSLPTPRESPVLGVETIPVSQREVEYPAMLEMHDASSLGSEEEVAQWRGKQTTLAPSAPAGEGVQLQRLPEEEQPKDTIEPVILRRGSTRVFDKTASITLAHLLSRRFDTHSGTIRESRLPGCPVGGWRHWRQNVPGHVCPATGRDWADFLRR
jgi:hypothetical protein